MKIPISISPCPIIEAIVEVRFESQIDDGAVFGMIFNSIKDDFKKTLDLPILSLPSDVRRKDPNLMFLPWYRLESISDKNTLMQVGPRTLSIISSKVDSDWTYPGWNKFSSAINFGIQKLKESGVANTVKRVSTRYINFFEENILIKTNFSILLEDTKLNPLNSNLRFEIPDGDFVNIVSVGNNVIRQLDNKIERGSVIDIDTYFDKELLNFFDDHESLINKSHDIEKKMFYRIVSKDYLSSLKDVKYAD